MLPLDTVTVENVIGSSPFAHGFLTRRNAAAPAASANTMIRGSQRFSFTVGKVIPRYEPKVARLLRYVAMKIALGRTVAAAVPSRERHFEPGGRALSRVRRECDIPAVGTRDPASERQAETDPAGLAGPAAVGAPERRERPVELGRRHADAAVDDLERDRRAVGLDREDDRGTGVRVLGRVVEQVVERPAQQHRIAADRPVAAGGIVRGPLELAAGVAGGEPAGRAVDQLA